MRIVVEIPTGLARRIFDAIDEGQFSSIDELAAAAFECYFRGGPGATLDAPTHVAHPSRERACAELSGSVHLAPNAATGRPVLRANAPWIWGMINRVFPLKLACRVCANLAQESPVTLTRFQTRVAECAAEVAEMLSADDREHRRKRNESRSVGLPGGKDLEKSKVRYAMHFVGRRSGSDYVGGCFEAGLIGPTDDMGYRVAPTALGWEFASLPNPVLDRDEPAGAANLSAAEAKFYLERVTARVAAEADAFSKVLTALERGPLAPEQLSQRVFPVVAPGVSDVVINTTRSGVLGRLVDLGAIQREPVGKSATYSIAERGREALALLSQQR